MPGIRPDGRICSHFEELRLKWRRHRLARSVVEAYFGGMGATLDEVETVGDHAHQVSPLQMLASIKGQGMWAFCSEPIGKAKSEGKPAVIHYWHDGRRHLADLAFMLGHEVGHAIDALDRPKVPRGAGPEVAADRAGMAVLAVLRHLRLAR